MVAVGCETEPVSKNEEFQAFAKKVLDIVDEKGAGAESELDAERTALVAKLGENIVVVGTAHYEASTGTSSRRMRIPRRTSWACSSR